MHSKGGRSCALWVLRCDFLARSVCADIVIISRQTGAAAAHVAGATRPSDELGVVSPQIYCLFGLGGQFMTAAMSTNTLADGQRKARTLAPGP